MIGTPPAELEIDERLIQSLLKDQFPDLAELSLCFIEEGFDNATWRLGEDLAVRIPRRSIATRFIANEQKWLETLAPQLPLPVPAPRHVGKPTPFYPWPWSVLPWFDGTPADLSELASQAAQPLAEFMLALHKPAPPGAPFNEFRCVPLAIREPYLAPRLDRLHESSDLITAQLDALWQEALAAPVDIETTWIHGDLHARNVLAKDGQISAVIDWGDMASGDRATDLASIWMLLRDREAREHAMKTVGPLTDATWLRAKGWAFSFGCLLLDSGLIDNPRHAEMGRRTLLRLAEDL